MTSVDKLPIQLQTNDNNVHNSGLVIKTKNKIKLKSKQKGKKASDIYKKMEHAEHIKEKPDTYIGSAEKENTTKHIYNDTNSNIKLSEISVAPGFYKCFDELLVNGHDHKQRMKKIAKEGSNHHLVTTIKIDFNEDGSISFYNDGDCILIEYME